LKERLQREEAIHDPSPFQRFKSTIRTPILLLGLLLPKKDQVTGKRRTRLFFISAAFFCGSVVAAYAAQALLVYSTTRFKFDATKVCPLQLTVLNPRLTKSHPEWDSAHYPHHHTNTMAPYPCPTPTPFPGPLILQVSAAEKLDLRRP
jgi:hypothetical protein